MSREKEGRFLKSLSACLCVYVYLSSCASFPSLFTLISSPSSSSPEAFALKRAVRFLATHTARFPSFFLEEQIAKKRSHFIPEISASSPTQKGITCSLMVQFFSFRPTHPLLLFSCIRASLCNNSMDREERTSLSSITDMASHDLTHDPLLLHIACTFLFCSKREDAGCRKSANWSFSAFVFSSESDSPSLFLHTITNWCLLCLFLFLFSLNPDTCGCFWLR